jgi:hypothetical protein
MSLVKAIDSTSWAVLTTVGGMQADSIPANKTHSNEGIRRNANV